MMHLGDTVPSNALQNGVVQQGVACRVPSIIGDLTSVCGVVMGLLADIGGPQPHL